jgi:transketolase
LRKAFIDAMSSLAAADERVLLLTGDLGYMVMEPFRERFPDRFINVGVAEQNMIGLATGLAEAGFVPYTYSIATFASLRPFEFIRNGPVLHHLPVRMVGMGMGFEYGHGGPSHYALEDVAALRTFPGLTVVIPADSPQTTAALRATHDLAGPVYYSLGKDDRTLVPGLDGRFELARVQTVMEGDDLAIVAMGSIAQEAAIAAGQLAEQGIKATVLVVSNFNPDPEEHLREILSRFRHVISVEAQTISGGLAALVGMVIAKHGLNCRLHPLAVCESPDGTTGSPADRWRKYSLDRTSIVRTALAAVGTALLGAKPGATLGAGGG